MEERERLMRVTGHLTGSRLHPVSYRQTSRASLNFPNMDTHQ